MDKVIDRYIKYIIGCYKDYNKKKEDSYYVFHNVTYAALMNFVKYERGHNDQ